MDTGSVSLVCANCSAKCAWAHYILVYQMTKFVLLFRAFPLLDSASQVFKTSLSCGFGGT